MPLPTTFVLHRRVALGRASSYRGLPSLLPLVLPSSPGDETARNRTRDTRASERTVLSRFKPRRRFNRARHGFELAMGV